VSGRNVSGITSLAEAHRIAVGLAEAQGLKFVVMHHRDIDEFDVEPARIDDEVGRFGVVEVIVP